MIKSVHPLMQKILLKQFFRSFRKQIRQKIFITAFITSATKASSRGTILQIAIKEIKKFDCVVHPIPTSQYPTPAKRPAYSGMSKEKISKTFGIILKDWKQSLEECLSKL